MLQCYNTTILQYYNTTILQYYSPRRVGMIVTTKMRWRSFIVFQWRYNRCRCKLFLVGKMGKNIPCEGIFIPFWSVFFVRQACFWGEKAIFWGDDEDRKTEWCDHFSGWKLLRRFDENSGRRTRRKGISLFGKAFSARGKERSIVAL